jgi:hypothetical protein
MSMLPKALETKYALEGSRVDPAAIQRTLDELKATVEDLTGNGYNWELSVTVIIGRKKL